MKKKLAAAIAYLKSRNIYVLDNNSFKPTPSFRTSVAQTIHRYLNAADNCKVKEKK